MASDTVFVSTDWLAERLDAPDIVVVDGSWYLPVHARDPHADYAERRIPGAVRFDIDAVKDTASDLPHMLPRPEAFASAVGAMGIGDGMRIVVYDGLGLFAAPRVRWTFRTFGAKDVVILEGGFPKWQAENRPVEQGPPKARAPRSFTARLDHSAVADAGDVARALEQVLADPDPQRAAMALTMDRLGRGGPPPGAARPWAFTILAAGKLGVVGLTKTVAKEWGQFKVNVNAVAFGFVDTRLTAAEKLRAIIESMFDPGICTPTKIAVWFAFFGDAHYRSVYRTMVAEFDTDANGAANLKFVKKKMK